MSEYAMVKVTGRADLHEIGEQYMIEEPVVRVFANMPFHCAVQIRVRCGTAKWGGGKHRNMIATAQLDRAGLIELRDAINTYLETTNG